jgi:hypothetical protein
MSQNSINIISFDVGIKNLAFCVLNLTNEIFTIKQWDVINLCEEKQICQEIVKNKLCKKEAKFIKNGNCYCNTHSKNKSYLVPPKELYPNSLKKLKINELNAMSAKYKIDCGTKPTKNLILEKFNSELNDNYFEIIKPIKAEHYDLVQLGINMRDKLNIAVNVNEIDLVVIENQISPIANRMKTLQGMIAQYFIMKDLNNVLFYSASNKLKPFLEHQKTTYKERKQLGVEFTKQLLDGYSQIKDWSYFFSQHSKKDDLADSFLQGISYFVQYKNLAVKL